MLFSSTKQNGLALKTYQSDIFNNWLDTDLISGSNGIAEITAIDTSSGSFSIDTLNLSRKVYDMLNRIAVSGGSYDDWLEAVYDHDVFGRTETPVYHGGSSLGVKLAIPIRTQGSLTFTVTFPPFLLSAKCPLPAKLPKGLSPASA